MLTLIYPLISVNFIKIALLIGLLGFYVDFFKYLAIILPLILSIAFLTVLERKILASMQRRRGPNVVGLFGFLQAFADGSKLILKETIVPSSSNYIIFIFSPIIIFSLSLYGWALIPFAKSVVIADLDLGVIILLAISSLSVLGIIMSGWASNSKYAFLGALRSSAQMISYEVSIGINLMPVLVKAKTLNLSLIVLSQNSSYNLWFFFPSFILFFICILAECNRIPFDLPESESELVAGYSVDILL